MYIIEIRVTISEETLESWDQSKSDIVLTGDIYSILQKYFYFSQNFVGKFRRDAEHWVEEATIDIVFRVIGITLREGYSLKEVRQLIRDEITHLISGLGSLSFAVSIEEDTSSNILIKITEDPLTAQNLTTIISTLTELYTKCWLIVQGRFPDLINYSQTHDIRFTKEANLTIGMLAHESPTLVELILNPPTLAAAAGAIVTLAGALKIAIDNIGQTSLRFKEKELDIEIRRKEAQQALQTASQKASLEGQKAQLEIEKQQLEIDRERLEVEKSRVEVALETAIKMVNMLEPNADEGTKAILAQTLLPSLLQQGNGKGLELALPAPNNYEEETNKTF